MERPRAALAQPVTLGRRPAGPEWPADGTLDVNALRERGWKPAPFGQFLFKVASRCNLDCDYCYIYHLNDTSWQRKPRFMSAEVLDQGLRRVREHAEEHGLDRVSLVLHGGEPLLAGADFIRQFTTRARAALAGVSTCRFTVQSNGTLVTPALLDLFLSEDVVIGISLDGDQAANDLHRLDRKGNSSYERVAAALAMLRRPEYRSRLSGLLCTINLEADPNAVYDGLLAFSPPWLDFLLPHGTWESPPPGRGVTGEAPTTPYADWLIPLFDRWFHAPRKPVRIRIFEELISLVLGGRSRYESFGLGMVNLIVVETDGTIEQVDSLKSAFEGAAETGLNIFQHSFDEALWSVEVVARQIGLDALCQTCQACELVSVCGGGLYPHRYKPGSGFLNPSVHCLDLQKLIRHVAGAVAAEVESRRREHLVASHPGAGRP
jgi:uncharacterized protein